MSQNILNLVDIGMVGHLGDTALAATGIGSFTNYLAISFIIGLSAGVQALAARRVGEERHSETAVPLNGGLILSLMIGVPLCAVLYMAIPSAYTFLSDDPAVIEQGVPYLQVRILSMVAVGMNFSFRGYWSAIHMTGVYLRTLLIMHAFNIFLNWVLIFRQPWCTGNGCGWRWTGDHNLAIHWHRPVFLFCLPQRPRQGFPAPDTQPQHPLAAI